MYKYIIISVPIYYFCNLSEYVLHKLSHNKNIKFLYKPHHHHHITEFPPNKLINNDHKARNIIYNEYLQICILIWIISYNLLQSDIFSILLIESFIYIYMCNLLHDSYHKDNTFFENFEWFKHKKQLHLIHHKKTYNNFNLFDNSCDKLINTYIK